MAISLLTVSSRDPSLSSSLLLSSPPSFPFYRKRMICMVSSSIRTDTANGGAANDVFVRKKLAVFVSGGGSNFQKIHEASLENRIYSDIPVVVSDKPACKACDYARTNNISVIEYPKSKFAEGGLSPAKLVTALRQYAVDFILLAGYLKLLPSEVVQAYP